MPDPRRPGKEYKPEDYLAAFARFVQENPAKIEAIRILLDRPRDWSTAALDRTAAEAGDRPGAVHASSNLQKAHAAHYHKALVDIISMVKHAAREEEPLLTAAERVERAFAAITAGKTFTAEQAKWLDRIRAHLVENLSIDRDDFDDAPVLPTPAAGAGDRTFDGKLAELLNAE